MNKKYYNNVWKDFKHSIAHISIRREQTKRRKMEAIWCEEMVVIEGGVDNSFEWMDDLIHNSIRGELEESFKEFLREYYDIEVRFNDGDTLEYEYIEEGRVLRSLDLSDLYQHSMLEFGRGDIPENIKGTECDAEYLVYYQLRHEWSVMCF